MANGDARGTVAEIKHQDSLGINMMKGEIDND